MGDAAIDGIETCDAGDVGRWHAKADADRLNGKKCWGESAVDLADGGVKDVEVQRGAVGGAGPAACCFAELAAGEIVQRFPEAESSDNAEGEIASGADQAG